LLATELILPLYVSSGVDFIQRDLFYLPTWCTIPLFYNICITLNTWTCFEQYNAYLQEVKTVFLQHLVSSLGRTVHRLRADCSVIYVLH
jgi:hypothetical protein